MDETRKVLGTAEVSTGVVLLDMKLAMVELLRW